jgi:ribonuclease HI
MPTDEGSLSKRLERLLLDTERKARPSHLLREVESAAVSLSEHAQENLSDLIEWFREAEAQAQAGKLGDLTAEMEAKASQVSPEVEIAVERAEKRGSKKKSVEIVDPPQAGEVTEATLYVDGGARGNPGPAAIGLVMESPSGEVVWTHAETIGEGTNNFAEYQALIRGLTGAGDSGVERLTVLSDSELVVKQLNGEYKVKNLALKPLHEEVKQLRRQFAFCRFRHIPRKQNRLADQLVNQALDEAAGAA